MIRHWRNYRQNLPRVECCFNIFAGDPAILRKHFLWQSFEVNALTHLPCWVIIPLFDVADDLKSSGIFLVTVLQLVINFFSANPYWARRGWVNWTPWLLLQEYWLTWWSHLWVTCSELPQLKLETRQNSRSPLASELSSQKMVNSFLEEFDVDTLKFDKIGSLLASKILRQFLSPSGTWTCRVFF